MTTNHIISDFVTRINNALDRNKQSVLVPKTNIISKILIVMEKEGFIIGHRIKNLKYLEVFLKYFQNKPVINNFNSISTPSRRVYLNKDNLIHWKNQNNSFDLLILSTNKGVLTHQDALLKRAGGEVLVSLN
jgi:small subunit ribosomal protein S8